MNRMGKKTIWFYVMCGIVGLLFFLIASGGGYYIYSSHAQSINKQATIGKDTSDDTADNKDSFFERLFRKEKDSSKKDSKLDEDQYGADKSTNAVKTSYLNNKNDTSNSSSHSSDFNRKSFEKMDRPSQSEVNKAQSNLDSKKSEFMADLNIPSVNIHTNILSGINTDQYTQMLYGAITMVPNQVIGLGNFPLASHNTGVDGQLFTHLDQVVEGTDIYVKDFKTGQEFHYQVSKKYYADFRDTSCLNETRNTQLTLITCKTSAVDQEEHDISLADKNTRLIVVANLV